MEVLTTLAIVVSYLGWVGAQITGPRAGLQRGVGRRDRQAGRHVDRLHHPRPSPLYGGMWAVAVTDFLQMIIIVIGMLWIGGEVSSMAGGVGVVGHAMNAGKFSFPPPAEPQGR